MSTTDIERLKYHRKFLRGEIRSLLDQGKALRSDIQLRKIRGHMNAYLEQLKRQLKRLVAQIKRYMEALQENSEELEGVLLLARGTQV